MVHFHRLHQMKKAELPIKDEKSQALKLVCQHFVYCKRRRPKLLSLLFLSVVSCLLILYLFGSSFTSIFSCLNISNESTLPGLDANGSVCSSVTPGTICCDRSAFRSDICFMKGDIRTNQASSSVFLYVSGSTGDLTDFALGDVEDTEEQDTEIQHEKIKPYTRKWETSVMDTIDELNLISLKAKSGNHLECDVKHDVPAVFFSTGGYTGNVYHEFNDGIIPLYITSQHFQKKVVFVILEYHDWWITKYGDILSRLSDYPAIDFSGDKRTHCFPEVIAGLKIHDELTVDPLLTEGNKNIVDFRDILDKAYWPRIKYLIQDEEKEAQEIRQNQSSLIPSSDTLQEDPFNFKKPILTIMSRVGSRAITNEVLLVKLAEEIGFQVQVLRPDKTTELAKIYRALNSSDVMIGVHGAAMTHCLFLKPGSVFIQVIPLGTAWAAETYYGEPAKKLGLKYIGYEILPRESSLYYKYDKKDPVLQNPTSITSKGWQYTKEIYLDGQNITLDLNRFYKRLVRSYHYSLPKTEQYLHPRLL